MGQITKQIKGKIIFKHETEADWNLSNYKPDNGEQVLYDPDDNYSYTRVKYGDGVNIVKDLPFSSSNALSVETDGAIAYEKSVPDGALSYAKLSKIGGMTHKCKNLLALPYAFQAITINGVQINANSDGSFAASGTCTAIGTCVVGDYLLKAGTYAISNNSANIGAQVWEYNNGTFSAELVVTFYNGSRSFTLTSDTTVRVRLYCGAGTTANGTFNVWINKDTALPYEPYFEGLRDTAVTEIKSVGANLFGGEVFADKLVEIAGATINEADKTVYLTGSRASGKTFFNGFKPNTRYTLILHITNGVAGAGGQPTLKFKYADGSNQAIVPKVDGESVIVCNSLAGKSVEALIGTNMRSTTYKYDGCGVFEGVLTEADFKPYTETSLAIPEAVQALDGYGWGVNDTCYNYIDWKKKQFVKRVGCVDMGTLGWVYDSNIFYAQTPGMREEADVLCASYREATSVYDFLNNSPAILAYYSNWKNAINVKDATYTDAASFKAAMSGVMLYYELATPEVTDISALFPEDNLIRVEANGVIRAVNEYNQAVPSEVTYYISEGEVEAIGAKTVVGDLVGTAQRAISDESGNRISETYALKSNTIDIGRKEGSQVGENSAAVGIDVVASGEVSLAQGIETAAYSRGAIAEGVNTQAGMRGYYMTGSPEYNNGEYTITLSDTQGEYSDGDIVGNTPLSEDIQYVIGDKVSIVNNITYRNCGTISSINGNKIDISGITDVFGKVGNITATSVEAGDILKITAGTFVYKYDPSDPAIELADLTFSAPVKSNDLSFTSMSYDTMLTGADDFRLYFGGKLVYSGSNGWVDEKYKTLIFDSNTIATAYNNYARHAFSFFQGCITPLPPKFAETPKEVLGSIKKIDESDYEIRIEVSGKLVYSKNPSAGGLDGDTFTFSSPFKSNGLECFSIMCRTDFDGASEFEMYYDSQCVYTESQGWLDDNYKILNFQDNTIGSARSQNEIVYGTFINCIEPAFAPLSTYAYSLYVENKPCIGITSIASGMHASGEGTQAIGHLSTAEGYKTVAFGKVSHAEGHSTKAVGDISHVEGYDTKAEYASHAEGMSTEASGQGSHSEGCDTLAGSFAFRILSTDPTGSSYFVEDPELKLSEFINSAALPLDIYYSVIMTNNYDMAGRITDCALQDDGTVMVRAYVDEFVSEILVSNPTGSSNTIRFPDYPELGYIQIGNYSHAEGYTTEAQSICSHAEGYNTKALGKYSHVEGRDTIAAYAAHAEGRSNSALGQCSHAEGKETLATKEGAHSEGLKTTASGIGSHAEGVGTIASGGQSHAEGNSTTAAHSCSFAGGLGTQSSANNQMTVGVYNKANANALFVVGNGTSVDARSNAFEVISSTEGVSIKIGNTVLDEATLKKLIENSNLLNAEEVSV